MSEDQIERHIDQMMEEIRGDECFDTKHPKSVTRSYLMGLKASIDTELDGLGGDDE